ncbi:MAG: Eco57I restriction-modification methylase domain-containing protein [Muribaculaceae bacterium]|nr:Eco57I restriction-modification methylase domain-containing protein [Muribaculaceae bacterium]
MTREFSILSDAIHATSTFVDSIPKAERKQYGQFFTSRKTAEFMASLFDVDFSKPVLRILDAGAGTGLLTAALVERLRKDDYSGEIHVVCYENDTKVLPILAANLENLKSSSNLKYEIRCDNYLLSQSFGRDHLFSSPERFDMIIGNPPYMKISINANEAKALSSVCYGAPNLYFLFWSMGINNLENSGELVYIIPRSWTSGAYFEKFRKYLFDNCIITNIHLFNSRDKVFDGDSVLQETMIIKIRRSGIKPEYIHMSSSSTSDFSDITHYDVCYNTAIASNRYVFLITNDKQAEVLTRINKLNHTLVSEKLQMRTGLIVDFRTREVLRDKEETGTYPLFYSQHIQQGKVIWPIGRENEFILTENKSHLQENTDYLFVKRFTAKEEKRRLQCGIYLSAKYSDFKYISTQNKINYIKCGTPQLAYGMFVIFNSTLYDEYYRILNGSTQVNSTEINNMPVPSREIIELMGRELMGKELNEDNCNAIIDKWIK